MGLYTDLGADEQVLVDSQVDRMMADQTRIPSDIRQKHAGDESGLRNALRDAYSDATHIDLLRQQKTAEGLMGGSPRSF